MTKSSAPLRKYGQTWGLPRLLVAISWCNIASLWKVIEAGGENTFLQKHQEFHSGVRADFYDTPQGVAKKTVVVK
jgi:hypothetical protein